jgi:hypothetical protein
MSPQCFLLTINFDMATVLRTTMPWNKKEAHVVFPKQKNIFQVALAG